MTDGVDPVQLLLDSLKIYSPTGKESPYARFLADRMVRLGYSKVRVDGVGNVLGQVGRGKVKLLLCGHMDTVPGRLPVRRTGDSIYGRGAADAKSPLCALLVAASAAGDSGLSITFAGVTEEEGDGAGINQLMTNPGEFDYAVFGEPAGANRITVAYRGRVALQVTVKTAGGHAGSPWAYKSAFDEFIATLSSLREYEESKEIPGDRFGSISLSPTLIRAGTYQNVVPNTCEATLDVRLPPGMPSSKAISAIRQVAERSKDGVSVRVEAGEPTEAYEVDSTSPLLRAFQRAIILKLKDRPGLIRKTSTGDMNTFAHTKHTACVTYGPGVSATSHTDEEVVQIADYLNSIEVLKESFHQLAVLGKRN
jgi:[amino group carrier protein]-lysine/ornithine hydrolase